MQPLPFDVFPGHSAVASLSLSTDGAIPSEFWAMAHARDAAAIRPPVRLRLGRVTFRPEAILKLMIAIILKEAARKGAVLREDFLRHGLKPIDIDRHYAEALRRAALQAPGLLTPEEGEAA